MEKDMVPPLEELTLLRFNACFDGLRNILPNATHCQTIEHYRCLRTLCKSNVKYCFVNGGGKLLSFIYSFILPFNRYLLSAYCVPGAIPSVCITTLHKIDKSLCLLLSWFSPEQSGGKMIQRHRSTDGEGCSCGHVIF